MVNAPLSGINGHYLNTDNSHLPFFGSTDNSRSYGLSGVTNNSLAASASRIKGGCWFSKRISKRRRNKKSLKKRRKSKSKRKYRGGSNFNPYASVQKGGLHSVTNFNNGYSTGGLLPANQLGLAIPVPYQPHANFINPHYPNQQLSF